MEPLAPGDPKQIGPYRLLFRLGAGGMGRVFLGSSPTGRPAAVKVVHPALARDPTFVDQFRREVAAAREVNAALTAPVVDAGPDDDPPWLATLFVAGPSLAEAVAEMGPLPLEGVWRLAGGLAEALAGVHKCGLVHRDLKPANVLLAVDGPLVIDFGISRALANTALSSGVHLGTPAFMSPEQAEGREAGPASDVFSLGSVIAFAATGTAPFAGGRPEVVLYQVVHAEPELAAIASRPLRDLVASCLEKEPAARPGLDQLAQAIEAGKAHYPDVSPGSFWPDPMAGFIRSRHDSLRSQIPPAPTTRQGAVIPDTEPAPVPDPGPTPPVTPPARPRRRPWAWIAGGSVLAAIAAIAVLLIVNQPTATPAAHAGAARLGITCHSPKVVIGAPAPGRQVPVTVTAQGTARCIPPRLALWLIVQAGRGFYPQAKVSLPRSGSGSWTQSVTFGAPQQAGPPLTLQAVGADPAASRTFATYLEQAAAGQHPPALSQAGGTYPQVVTYASASVALATPPPAISLTAPKRVLNCPATTPQCQFAVTGHSSGVTSGLEIFVLVFPVQPAGNGWYIQVAPASISGKDDWTQAPSYLGAAAFPAHNGDTLQIEAVVVRANAIYNGIRLSVLASHAQPITDPRQIHGLLSQSNIVALRVQK